MNGCSDGSAIISVISCLLIADAIVQMHKKGPAGSDLFHTTTADGGGGGGGVVKSSSAAHRIVKIRLRNAKQLQGGTARSD